MNNGQWTNDKIMEVCITYEQKLVELQNLQDLEYSPKLLHLVSMLPKLREFVVDDRRDKAFHWLGFIQGVLWAEGVYSIEELKKHNMPEGEESSADA